MKKFLWSFLIVAIIFIIGLAIGWFVSRGTIAKKEVASQVIFNALQERGFLITQTSVLNVSTMIASNGNASWWKKLLWGQEINASGVVEVNLGVDLDKTDEKDIEIGDRSIIVKIESAKIFNSRLVGDINVENKQGILKRLLQNDDGYNQAMIELIQQGESVVLTKRLLDVANNKAIEEIERLIGYMDQDKDIIVLIKENEDESVE